MKPKRSFKAAQSKIAFSRAVIYPVGRMSSNRSLLNAALYLVVILLVLWGCRTTPSEETGNLTDATVGAESPASFSREELTPQQNQTEDQRQTTDQRGDSRFSTPAEGATGGETVDNKAKLSGTTDDQKLDLGNLPPMILLKTEPAGTEPPGAVQAESERKRVFHDAAMLYFNRLTESQKIAQHFISWLPRSYTSGELEKQIRAGIGGFIIYPWNYEDREDLKQLIARLHRLARGFNAGIDLFICGDQEGGRVNAYRFDTMVRLPAQADWGAYGDERFARSLGYVNGLQLRELGFNMNLAPVLDLTAQADSSIIGDRALGNDPNRVGRLGGAYIRGMQESGIMAVAKHFPGHGVSRVDSHISLPVSDVTLSDLLRRELIPFQYAAEQSVAGIMTAHILFPRVDRRWPVTLSRIFIRDLLKTYLRYDGLVVSDGLSMGALAKHYQIDETLARCLNAGVDILLIHDKYDVNDLIYRTRRMIQEGLISRELVMEGTVKILEKKAEFGLLPLTAAKNAPDLE